MAGFHNADLAEQRQHQVIAAGQGWQASCAIQVQVLVGRPERLGHRGRKVIDEKLGHAFTLILKLGQRTPAMLMGSNVTR